MKAIARKTKRKTILRVELILGMVIMAAACVALPIGVFSIDLTFFTNIYIWGVLLLGMLFFSLVGFFCFVRPYFLFQQLPEVQAETDGTYLYIYSKKQAKIPLADMGGAYLDAHTPYMMSREFIVHLLSEQYGTVIIKVPKYGTYKLYFISGAAEIPHVIAALVKTKL